MEVLPQPYHMQATPTPRRWRPSERGVEGAARAVAASQPGFSASRHSGRPPESSTLAGGGRVAAADGIEAADAQRSMPERDRRGRPSAPRARWRPAARRSRGRRRPACRWCRPRGCGPARSAPCRARWQWTGTRLATVGPPGGIGTGVEVAVEAVGEQPALRVRRGARLHRGGMALGGGGHRFRARIDDAHRPPGDLRRDRQQRLDGHVELAAEAAAAGGGLDADLRRLRRPAPARPPRDPCRAPGCRRRPPSGRRRARRSRPRARCRRARRSRSRSAPSAVAAAAAWPACDVAPAAGSRGSGRCPARAHAAAARPRPAPASIAGQRRQRLQAIGRSASATPSTAAFVADQRQHRLAAEADDAVGEDRLVLEMRRRCRSGSRPARPARSGSRARPGTRPAERVEIAEREARATHAASARRASTARRRARRRRRSVGARHLRPAVERAAMRAPTASPSRPEQARRLRPAATSRTASMIFA